MKASRLPRLATFALVALIVAASLVSFPGLASASTAAAPQAQSVCLYTVQYGDTLYSIAARYNTTVWELMRLNMLSYYGWLYAGQTIRVPCGSDGNPSGCTYRATYVADITVPDGANVIAGSHFPKIWRVRNTGSCTWGNGYPMHSLVWVGGNQLGAPSSVEMNAIVRPGYEVEMVVPMVAPSLDGRYRSDWKFKVDGGPLVGVGRYNSPLYVDFNVMGQAPAAPIRIQFAPGATSATVNGATKNGQSVRYVLSARGGQVMSVSLLGIVPTKAALAVNSVSTNELLLPSIYGQTSFSTTLPSTQDYVITIAPTTSDTVNYTLQVVIK